MSSVYIWLFILLSAVVNVHAELKTAVFAGGCFWCMEPPFDDLDGVTKAVSGYIGGTKENATYKNILKGNTGHFEAIAVTYNTSKIKYQKLLDVFWSNVDPFDDSGQFCDKGEQYLSAIFYGSERERKEAEKSKITLQQKFKNKEIKTQLIELGTFYPAESYHQDYYLKNPVRFKYYKYRCGREQRLKELDIKF